MHAVARTAQRPARRVGAAQRRGFTLMEVVVSVIIISLSLGAILSVYVQSAVRSEWSAYSLAAQMMAVSGMEQCRAAKFDPRGSPAVDALQSTNFPTRVDVLDVGTLNRTVTYATNTTTILTVSTTPPLKLVRVDCTWTFPRRGVFTNSVFTYRAANQ
jgi:prepilin-type N-terminal cleavage/methylation domain-containing protein